MKTKSLFIIALLSLFSLSAFAADSADSVKVTYIGTPTENLLDSSSVPMFTVGTEVTIKAEFSNPAACTAITIDMLNDGWATIGSATSYKVPANGILDTVYVISEETPLSFFPDSASNKALKFRVKLTYPDGAAFAFPRVDTYPINGEYPEVVTRVIDVFDVTMKVYGADTTEYGMSNWINYSVKAGDILHFVGTYSPTLGDSAKAILVGGGINYYPSASVWGETIFKHGFVAASTDKGNVDGIIDYKILVPYFTPDSLLKGSQTYVGDAKVSGADNPYHPLLQFRVTYDIDVNLEGQNGSMGKNNTFQNWWGPLSVYDGDMPTLAANVTGIEVSDIEDVSVSLAWDLASDAVWDIVIGKKGDVRQPSSEPFITTAGIKTVIAGLEPGTDYELFVRSVSNPDTTNASVNREVGAYNAEAIEFTTTGTASLRSVNVNNNVSIYPNPTTGIITISADKAYAVTVCDLAGRAIMRKSMTSASQELDLSDINNGIYLLQFNDGEQSFAKKFMKQ